MLQSLPLNRWVHLVLLFLLGPVDPVKPLIPVMPAAPVAPVDPVLPVAPLNPFAPDAPVAPVGCLLSQPQHDAIVWSSIRFNIGFLMSLFTNVRLLIFCLCFGFFLFCLILLLFFIIIITFINFLKEKSMEIRFLF